MPVRVWLPLKGPSDVFDGERYVDYPKGDGWALGEHKELDVYEDEGVIASIADGQWKRVEFFEDAPTPHAVPDEPQAPYDAGPPADDATDYRAVGHRPEPGEVVGYSAAGNRLVWPEADPAHPDGLPVGTQAVPAAAPAPESKADADNWPF